MSSEGEGSLIHNLKPPADGRKFLFPHTFPPLPYSSLMAPCHSLGFLEIVGGLKRNMGTSPGYLPQHTRTPGGCGASRSQNLIPWFRALVDEWGLPGLGVPESLPRYPGSIPRLV